MPATLCCAVVAPFARPPVCSLRSARRSPVFASAAEGPNRRRAIVTLLSTAGGVAAMSAAAAPGPGDTPSPPEVKMEIDAPGSPPALITGSVPKAELAPGLEISRIIKVR